MKATKMEIDDLRALSDEDLDNELYDTHRELMNLRFRAATMQLSNVNEISSAKKRVARINTLIRERELTRAAV
jgi:large subunit ribosomal protein L29|tara:strand:- start:821 stop:1039 length:219 start_codon:yes stop_codon:yes gene_type:complete